MAEATDPTAIDRFVGQIVGHATERLSSSATEAQNRHAALLRAQETPGNNIRSADIDASLRAEQRTIDEAKAVAHQLPPVRQLMITDLEALLKLALSPE